MRLRRLMFVVFVGACTGKGAKDECREHEDCGLGMLCVRGRCTEACWSDLDCSATNDCERGRICENGACVPGCRPRVPVITEIDGTGTELAVSRADVSGRSAVRRVRTELAVAGEALAGSVARLVAVDGASHDLLVTSSSEGSLRALIPEELRSGLQALAQGRYMLEVENAAGIAAQDVWLLQGEPASPAAIEAVVASMPEMNANVTSLGGRPAAGYQDTLSWGRVYEADGAPIAFNATVGTAVDDPTASGGRARKALYGDAGGRMWGVHAMGEQKELLARGPVEVDFQLKVHSNDGEPRLLTLICHVLRNGASRWNVLAARNVSPKNFLEAGAWQTFPLDCDFRPDDQDQFIGIDGFASGVTDVSLDYVRVTPKPGGSRVKSFSVDGTTTACHAQSGDVWTTIPEMSLDVALDRPATLLIEFDMNVVGSDGVNPMGGCNGCWAAYRLTIGGVPESRGTHVNPQGGNDEDAHVHLHRVAQVEAGVTKVAAQWGQGSGTVCNPLSNDVHWMRRLSVIAFQN